jgi:outer membrane protein assembly factor BamD (BamD/ComL family)
MPGSTLRAELELMSQVQTALRDNRGVRALSLLERYDDAFPRGQLGTERLAAEVFAACQVGDVARARRAATKFLQRDASSTLAERVKGACIDSERAR